MRRKIMKVYSGRVEALESILPYLKSKKEKYVIMMERQYRGGF